MGDRNRDEDYGDRPIFTWAKETLLAPIRILTSPVLLRTYLRTILFLITSFTLFAIAVVAYTSFYLSYIPVRGIDVPVYLQFDPAASHSHTTSHLPPFQRARFPHGTTLIHGIASRQKYDVVVEMRLPRSTRNLQAGNWMVGLEMRGPGEKDTSRISLGGVVGGVKGALGWMEEWDVEDYSYGETARGEKIKVDFRGTHTEGGVPEGVPEGPLASLAFGHQDSERKARREKEKGVLLAQSRRPAILTYRSWMTEVAYRALRLPSYILGWRVEEEMVVVKMMEGVEFEKGWRNVPRTLRLEVRSGVPLEVYKVGVKFVARLEGLRWVMYNYRILSALVFTSAFWGVEMTVLLVSWGVLELLFSNPGTPQERESEQDEKKRIKSGLDTGTGATTPKTEPADSEPSTPLSDASRTFPTLSSHQPLHYSSSDARQSAKVKPERMTPRLEDVPLKTEAEADDEDEDEDADFILEEPGPSSAPAGGFTDSGIGTSLESERGQRGVVRRRSGGLGGGRKREE
ncbi:putative adipose-regulatory protein-domain-containing protein [Clohesyomyces aquaticus]|uniref:Putative adipose-regulatory protein-domain-containing protein n=1 Tax=Clohesyomyces aquaticus TaxID=1231657 RepID=A0A1Y1YNU6_9PLEO|nr:putative adipose-regulatory protein-domain-containing protein [Clohesyomyces aquaticus]